MLTYHKTTQEEKHAICEWKYDGEYAVYNVEPYEEQIRNHRGFADPRNSYYSFCHGKKLIGFINLIEGEASVFFGIGLDPVCCGLGFGTEVTREALRLSHLLYPEKKICLIVRTWNARAINCYIKAGFRVVGDPVAIKTPTGEDLFYRMEAD